MNPGREEWGRLAERNVPDDTAIAQSVGNIVAQVKDMGDAALRQFAKAFDGAELRDIEVSQAEIEAADSRLSPELKEAIDRAVANVTRFHEAQIPAQVDVEVMPGVRCLQRAVPIRRVGLYIPGGRAPLFSTVIMLAVPARLAGCAEVVLCTPRGAAGISPEILYTARRCGVDRIYGVGGAQAIAAMAYGTESIPAVNKIFGPGNRFVTKAKQLVSGKVAIDMPAGPSEVLVMADSSADPRFVAADLLSQAEHGPDSQAILVTDSGEMAESVKVQIDALCKSLTRQDSVEGSLSKSRLIVLADRGEMVDFANFYAPEHLIISTRDPWEIADRIEAAGSVFIGNFSPESAGDYASGTNHTLPTSGWASALSGVNIDSFMHKVTFQQLTREGLASLSSTIVAMAEAEGLDAHALAVKVRTEKQDLPTEQ